MVPCITPCGDRTVSRGWVPALADAGGGTWGWLCQTHHLSLLLLPLLSPLRVDLQGGKFGCALLDGGERCGSVQVGNCTNR